MFFRIQFQKRQKQPNLIQEHFQSFEPRVSIHSVDTLEPLEYSLNNNCEHNLYNLLIDLRKETRSCTKYLISHFVSTKQLSMQYQIFLSTICAVRIPTTIQKASKDNNWVQVMNEDECLRKDLDMRLLTNHI